MLDAVLNSPLADFLGRQTRDLSVEEFKAYVESEYQRWKKVIETAQIRID